MVNLGLLQALFSGLCPSVSTAYRAGHRVRRLFQGVGLLVKWVMTVLLMATVIHAAQLPATASYRGPDCDPACQGLLRERLDFANQHAAYQNPSHLHFLAFELSPGYNCKGYVWISDARTVTVFDTGSSRNSIDKEYLRALLSNDRTRGAVKSVHDIKPLECRSVDAANPIMVKQIVLLEVTFKERSGKATTKTIGCCVVNNST